MDDMGDMRAVGERRLRAARTGTWTPMTSLSEGEARMRA